MKKNNISKTNFKSEQEIDITVSLTISKNMTITTPNNKTFTTKELERELINNVYLPHTVYEDLKNILKDIPNTKTLINDLEGWNEDDLAININ